MNKEQGNIREIMSYPLLKSNEIYSDPQIAYKTFFKEENGEVKRITIVDPGAIGEDSLYKTTDIQRFGNKPVKVTCVWGEGYILYIQPPRHNVNSLKKPVVNSTLTYCKKGDEIIIPPNSRALFGNTGIESLVFADDYDGEDGANTDQPSNILDFKRIEEIEPKFFNWRVAKGSDGQPKLAYNY